jgi:hypothetical protein
MHQVDYLEMIRNVVKESGATMGWTQSDLLTALTRPIGLLRVSESEVT